MRARDLTRPEFGHSECFSQQRLGNSNDWHFGPSCYTTLTESDRDGPRRLRYDSDDNSDDSSALHLPGMGEGRQGEIWGPKETSLLQVAELQP